MRIQFNKNVSQSAVSNNDIVILVSNIYQHFIRCDYTQALTLYKQPYIDYMLCKPQLFQFAINPMVTGNKYTVNLTSFHPQSAFLLCYINKQNPTFTEQTVFYPIKDIEIQDNANKNIHNQVVFNKPLLRNEILKYFKEVPWLKENIDTMNLINFCLDPRQSIKHNITGGNSFSDSDFKFIFTA